MEDATIELLYGHIAILKSTTDASGYRAVAEPPAASPSWNLRLEQCATLNLLSVDRLEHTRKILQAKLASPPKVPSIEQEGVADGGAGGLGSIRAGRGAKRSHPQQATDAHASLSSTVSSFSAEKAPASNPSSAIPASGTSMFGQSTASSFHVEVTAVASNAQPVIDTSGGVDLASIAKRRRTEASGSGDTQAAPASAKPSAAPSESLTAASRSVAPSAKVKLLYGPGYEEPLPAYMQTAAQFAICVLKRHLSAPLNHGTAATATDKQALALLETIAALDVLSSCFDSMSMVDKYGSCVVEDLHLLLADAVLLLQSTDESVNRSVSAQVAAAYAISTLYPIVAFKQRHPQLPSTFQGVFGAVHAALRNNDCGCGANEHSLRWMKRVDDCNPVFAEAAEIIFQAALYTRSLSWIQMIDNDAGLRNALSALCYELPRHTCVNLRDDARYNRRDVRTLVTVNSFPSFVLSYGSTNPSGIAIMQSVLRALDEAIPPESPEAHEFVLWLLGRLTASGCPDDKLKPLVLRMTRLIEEFNSRRADERAYAALQRVKPMIASIRKTVLGGIPRRATSTSTWSELLTEPLAGMMWLPNSATYVDSSFAEESPFAAVAEHSDTTHVRFAEQLVAMFLELDNPAARAPVIASILTHKLSIVVNATANGNIRIAADKFVELCKTLGLSSLPECVTLQDSLRKRSPIADLYSSVWVGDLPATEAAIAAGANVSMKLFRSVIVVASCFGHVDVVKCLLKHLPRADGGGWAPHTQADINEALRYACAFGHADVVSELLDAGASVKLEDHYRVDGHFQLAWPPGIAAAGNSDVTEVLRRHGVDVVEPATFNTLTPVSELGSSDEPDAATFAKLRAAWPAFSDLQAACLLGCTNIAQRELNRIADWKTACESVSGAPMSPLALAVIAHQESCVACLLECDLVRAHVNWKDGVGWTALHYAVVGDDDLAAKIAGLLISKGANPSLCANTESDIAPYADSTWDLWLSSFRASEDVARVLLAMGHPPVSTYVCGCRPEAHEDYIAFPLLGYFTKQSTSYDMKAVPIAQKLSVVLEGTTPSQWEEPQLEARHGRGQHKGTNTVLQLLNGLKMPALTKALISNAAFSRREAAIKAWRKSHSIDAGVAPTSSHVRPAYLSYGFLAAMPIHDALEAVRDMTVLAHSMPSDFTTLPVHEFRKFDARVPLLFGIPRGVTNAPEAQQLTRVRDMWKYLQNLPPAAFAWIYLDVVAGLPYLLLHRGAGDEDAVAIVKRIIRVVTSSPLLRVLAPIALAYVKYIVGERPHLRDTLQPDFDLLVPNLEFLVAEVLRLRLENDANAVYSWVCGKGSTSWRSLLPVMHDDEVKAGDSFNELLRLAGSNEDICDVLAAWLQHPPTYLPSDGHQRIREVLEANCWHICPETGEATRKYIPDCFLLLGTQPSYDEDGDGEDEGDEDDEESFGDSGSEHEDDDSPTKLRSSARVVLPVDAPCPDVPLGGGYAYDVPCDGCKKPLTTALDIDLTDSRFNYLRNALKGMPRLRIPHCCACCCNAFVHLDEGPTRFTLDTLRITQYPTRHFEEEDYCEPDSEPKAISGGYILLGGRTAGALNESGGYYQSVIGGKPEWIHWEAHPLCEEPECKSRPMLYVAAIGADEMRHTGCRFHVFVCTSCCRHGASIMEDEA